MQRFLGWYRFVAKGAHSLLEHRRTDAVTVGIVAFIAAFGCLIGLRFAAKRSPQLSVWLLAAFGVLIGLAVAPTVAYYGNVDPRALWEAGGATALFIAGFGAAGYATRRDLTALARVSFWALLALIVAGIVLIFVHIPGAAVTYSVLGLIIFAGFTMFDRSCPLVRAGVAGTVGSPRLINVTPNGSERSWPKTAYTPSSRPSQAPPNCALWPPTSKRSAAA